MTNPLRETVREARARLLQMHSESGVGHLGGNLSCLDALMTLHHQILRPEDTFVLSKGHAAGALYVTLWSLGKISDEELRQFHKDGTRLSGHPAPGKFPEIPFATGSLGHGLSLASGLALGKALQNQRGRVYCLLSDGEWQEGSCWEALIFLQKQNLPVTLIVDANGLQGFGRTSEMVGGEDLAVKFRAFGVPVRDIDGHDLDALHGALSESPHGPQAVIARTRKGCGVSFMENQLEWHYLPLTPAQYAQARAEVFAQ